MDLWAEGCGIYQEGTQAAQDLHACVTLFEATGKGRGMGTKGVIHAALCLHACVMLFEATGKGKAALNCLRQ